MMFAVQVGGQEIEIEVDPDDVAVATAQMILRSYCGRHAAAIRVRPVDPDHGELADHSGQETPTSALVS
jgi:hypothetical protein